VVANHRLGVIAARNRQFDEAMAYLERAERSAPDHVELLSDIGYALYMQNDLAQAETKLRRALAVDPQCQSARNNLGLVLGELGRLDESLAEFRLAVGEADAHTNLAYVQALRGDVEGAKASYHHALNIDAKIRPAAEALVQLATAGPPPSPRRQPAASQQQGQQVAEASQPPPHGPVDSQFQPDGNVVPVGYHSPVPNVSHTDGRYDRDPLPQNEPTSVPPQIWNWDEKTFMEGACETPGNMLRSQFPSSSRDASTPWPNSDPE
jgi:Flp pilus assembly protein TadD